MDCGACRVGAASHGSENPTGDSITGDQLLQRNNPGKPGVCPGEAPGHNLPTRSETSSQVAARRSSFDFTHPHSMRVRSRGTARGRRDSEARIWRTPPSAAVVSHAGAPWQFQAAAMS
jgi:hypothetical protein